MHTITYKIVKLTYANISNNSLSNMLIVLLVSLTLIRTWFDASNDGCDYSNLSYNYEDKKDYITKPHNLAIFLI